MILVVDGQGGGIGKAVIEALIRNDIEEEIIAVGTNSLATANMIKAGATAGATGENPVVYNSKRARVIIGPIGICFANSMYGEITPLMSNGITTSSAEKLLIPISKCQATILGATEKSIGYYLEEMIKTIKNLEK